MNLDCSTEHALAEGSEFKTPSFLSFPSFFSWVPGFLAHSLHTAIAVPRLSGESHGLRRTGGTACDGSGFVGQKLPGHEHNGFVGGDPVLERVTKRGEIEIAPEDLR